MLSAAVLNTPAALRSASSLPPSVSCALKACTETIGAGLVTVVAERAAAAGLWVAVALVAAAVVEFMAASVAASVDAAPEPGFADCAEASSRPSSSFACVISPRAVNSCGKTSTRIL
jgi:hypothetical protein